MDIEEIKNITIDEVQKTSGLKKFDNDHLSFGKNDNTPSSNAMDLEDIDDICQKLDTLDINNSGPGKQFFEMEKIAANKEYDLIEAGNFSFRQCENSSDNRNTHRSLTEVFKSIQIEQKDQDKIVEDIADGSEFYEVWPKANKKLIIPADRDVSKPNPIILQPQNSNSHQALPVPTNSKIENITGFNPLKVIYNTALFDASKSKKLKAIKEKANANGFSYDCLKGIAKENIYGRFI